MTRYNTNNFVRLLPYLLLARSGILLMLKDIENSYLLFGDTPLVRGTATGDVASATSPFVVDRGGVIGSTLPTDGSGGVDAAV